MEDYAIVESGGRQYRVKSGDHVWLEKIEGDPGEDVELNRVLAVSKGGQLTIGKPDLPNVKILASVEATQKTDKTVVFKYRPKTRYRRKLGCVRSPNNYHAATADPHFFSLKSTFGVDE